MKIFGLNITVSKEPAEEITRKSFGVTPADWLRGKDLDYAPMLRNAYEQVVWVYRAVNVLAEQVANIPFTWSTGARGRESLIDSGPLLNFYNQPHPQINRFQYWELRVIWLMLRGECFRIPVFEDGPGSTAQRPRLKTVLILDPASFQHIVENNQLIGWRYSGAGSQGALPTQVFLPEEVWHEKLPNPFDFWRGLSPLQVAGMPAQTEFAAGAFMRGIIENNADSGVIVRTDKWVSDEQREQIVTALEARKRRAGVADRPMLLPGSAEIIRPQLSSSDLQFLENRKFSRSEICAAFGVPEEIVSSTEHAKYDVMAGARLNFIENRVAPLCSRLEAAEDVTVKAIEPRANGWFDLDSLPIMQEARRNRLAAAKTGFEMGIPFNELNRVLDLGFKPLPWGNTGHLPGTLQDAGRL
jgi:HK97 family phage portal protein